MEKAEKYSKTSPYLVPLYKPILGKYQHLIKWQEQDPCILEAGIGNGAITKEVIMPFLPTKINEYIGLDLSENMLKMAETIIDDPKFSTLHMDICTKNIPIDLLNRFDKIFAFNLLHMLSSNIKLGLDNLYKLVKPGGQLIYSAFDRLPMDMAFKKLDETKWKKYQHSNVMSPFWNSTNPFEQYRNLTLDAGFQEDIITVFSNMSLCSPDEQTARDIQESVNLIFNEVSHEEYSEYLKDYFQALDDTTTLHFDETTGRYGIKVNIIFAIVTKKIL